MVAVAKAFWEIPDLYSRGCRLLKYLARNLSLITGHLSLVNSHSPRESTMSLSENTRFFCPVKINAGKKALDHLPFELDSLGAKNPFLITSVETTQRGLVKKVINAFKDSGMSLAVFDETGPVSSLQSVLQAAKLFENTGCDAVVALGSNPVMNMAKALNILVSQKTVDLEAYSTGKSFEKPMKPFISVPCFSGDGQESGPHARVGKMTFYSLALMPNLVIIDPALISSERPLKLTTSAMRAMTCAMESYIAHPRNSLTEAFAHVAIQLVFLNLLKAVKREDRKKSQHALLMAETISECAFCNATPGMAYTLGLEVSKHCMVPQGLCMGILLPHVLDYVSGVGRIVCIESAASAVREGSVCHHRGKAALTQSSQHAAGLLLPGLPDR